MTREKRTTHVANRNVLYALAFSLASAIAAAAVCIIYTGIVDRESNQQWCSLVTLLDDTYIQTPPATEVGRKVAEAMHTLRIKFEC